MIRARVCIDPNAPRNPISQEKKCPDAFQHAIRDGNRRTHNSFIIKMPAPPACPFDQIGVFTLQGDLRARFAHQVEGGDPGAYAIGDHVRDFGSYRCHTQIYSSWDGVDSNYMRLCFTDIAACPGHHPMRGRLRCRSPVL